MRYQVVVAGVTHSVDEVREQPSSDACQILGRHAERAVEHDDHVGQLLAKLDELGITDNTIVLYSTDNGAEIFTWPDGGTTPFHGEKATTWEGGFRVPAVIRWPGVVEPGTVINDIFHHMDWMPSQNGVPASDANATEVLTPPPSSFVIHPVDCMAEPPVPEMYVRCWLDWTPSPSPSM